MRDIILIICIIVFMVGSFFAVGKIGEFFNKNYKLFNYKENGSKKTVVGSEEKRRFLLRKFKR